MNNHEIAFQQKIESLKEKPFEEIQRFLSGKKFRFSKCTELFWKSDLPKKWAKKLLNLPNILDLLFDYFSKAENLNPTFLNDIAKTSPRLLRKAIKLSKAFEIEEHWNSFGILKTVQNRELKVFYKELEYIRRLTKKWKEKAKFYKGVIHGIDYEDLLIHVISYFENFKRSEKTIGNQSLLISHEISLCYVLNNMLNIKKAIVAASAESTTNKYTVLEFKEALKKSLPPLNTEEGLIQNKYLPVESISSEKKLIRETIDFYFAFFATNYQIDLYLCGFAEFELIDGMEADLRATKRFAIHQRNDKKSWYQENLARNKTFQRKKVADYLNKDINIIEKQTFLSIQAADEYWRYLKLPQKISLENGGFIEVKQLFTALYTFSNYLMPAGRVVIYSEEDSTQAPFVFQQEKPEEFSSLFYNDYLFVIDEDQLLQYCVGYFGWEETATKVLIDFLTTDLNSDESTPIDFLFWPLIKIGNQYIWLSSLLKNRRWEVLMHKRWAEENLGNKSDQSSAIEEGIAENFKRAGFGACASYEFKKKKVNGEIDTIAYRDNILFILELKTTYLDENLLRYSRYESLRFEYKAYDQLNKTEEYIRTNFEEIKRIPELGIDCNLEDLEIIPLIVSNIFEMDDHLIKGKYRKISLFELVVILNNDLYDTLNNRMNSMLSEEDQNISFSALLQSFNRHAPHFNKGNLKFFTAEKFNLWSNPRGCAAQDLLDAIEQKKAWQGLDELIEFGAGGAITLSQPS